MTPEASADVRPGRLVDLVDELRRLPSETEWLEFKDGNTDPARTARTASAIANSARLADHPCGYICWGVEDAAHAVVGSGFEPGREKVGNQPFEFWLARTLRPSPALRFHVVPHPAGRVVLLEIPAADSVPVKHEDVAYIRVGSATPKLSEFPDREATLLAKLRPFAWERGAAMTYVESGEVLDLLDHEAYFAMTGRRAPETRAGVLDRMAEDRLVARDVGGRWTILNLGAILFAKRLDRFDGLSRKAPRVIQYDGESRVVTRRRVEATRGYAAGFEALLTRIGDLLPTGERIESLREEHRVYPAIAVRELVANALIHQDMTITGAGPMVEVFDGRVEVTNPGAPITDMLRKLFGSPPRSRNEALATLMRRMGVCEEQGSGLVKVISSVEERRLPAPSFALADGSLKVTLFGPRDFADMDRLDRQRVCQQHAALLYHSGRRMTNASLRDRLGIRSGNAAQVSRLIKDCVGARVVKVADPDRPKGGYVPDWA